MFGAARRATMGKDPWLFKRPRLAGGMSSCCGEGFSCNHCITGSAWLQSVLGDCCRRGRAAEREWEEPAKMPALCDSGVMCGWSGGGLPRGFLRPVTRAAMPSHRCLVPDVDVSFPPAPAHWPSPSRSRKRDGTSPRSQPGTSPRSQPGTSRKFLALVDTM